MCRTYRRDFASNLQYKFKGKLWRRCPICQNVISNQHIHNRGPVLLSEIMSSHVDSMHLHCYLYVMMWNVKKGTCLVNFVINFNLFKSGLKHNIKIYFLQLQRNSDISSRRDQLVQDYNLKTSCLQCTIYYSKISNKHILFK